MNRKKTLLTILGRRDFEKIPSDIVAKIEKGYEDVHKELTKSREANNESLKNAGKDTFMTIIPCGT